MAQIENGSVAALEPPTVLPADSPLDLLAEEFGAVAGRIEREIRQGFETVIAKLEKRIAELELHVHKGETDRSARLAAQLLTVRDGRDGVDGKDADLEPLEEAVSQRLASLGLAFADLETKIADRLASLKDGRDGAPGDPGARGEAGPPGKLPVVRNWTARVHYEGDVVVADGSTYQAVRDTGGAPPGEDWQPLALRGEDAKTWTHRGTWNANEIYQQNDVVALNGSSFLAVKAEPGQCPGDGWQLLASAGKRGKDGEGKKGDKGDKGDKGEAGAAIIGGIVTDDLTLILTNDNGDNINLDLVPLAEAIVGRLR